MGIFKASLGELVDQSVEFCTRVEDVGKKKCMGLLLTGANKEAIEQIRRSFVKKTNGKYPVVVVSRREYKERESTSAKSEIFYGIDVDSWVPI